LTDDNGTKYNETLYNIGENDIVIDGGYYYENN
jgi:hypothetical protein